MLFHEVSMQTCYHICANYTIACFAYYNDILYIWFLK